MSFSELSFSELSLSAAILESVRRRGHQRPAPIQSAAIPVVLAGRDLIATAATGSGKTAAFLLPILDRLHRNPSHGIGALILAPTRELASQIALEFQRLSVGPHMRAAVIVGGASMVQQIRELRNGAQVVVACPGRLVDHLERGTIKLDQVKVVVIDEADRMLDMGFLPQLRRVLRAVRKPRQSLMFSATMDSEVERVAREFLSDPVKVRMNDTATPPAAIRQAIYPVTQQNKAQILSRLLRREGVSSAIVFARTRSRADRVTEMLARDRISVVAIHGGRSQNQRNAALAGFRSGHYSVLIATDIAARGLDIPDVSHVVNFDLPEAPDTYIHRIGRTARMGKSGEALSLVMPEDGKSLRGIERTLGVKLERARVSEIATAELDTAAPEPAIRQSIARRANGDHHRKNPGLPSLREENASLWRRGA
ncbi:MAG TPA: DEAD/DEAH box helicase [Candidatus Binataceae bacterium]|nr:DEAD/DEAH box helicase [Candidatus Binataceae bacterium]